MCARVGVVDYADMFDPAALEALTRGMRDTIRMCLLPAAA